MSGKDPKIISKAKFLFFVILIKSFLKKKIIAKREPKWRLISSCSELNLNSEILEIIIKWAEELTGINSENPCMNAKIEASKYFEII